MAGKEWLQAGEVLCVSCPDCGFTMDADHTQVEGDEYVCPCCAEARVSLLADEIERDNRYMHDRPFTRMDAVVAIRKRLKG